LLPPVGLTPLAAWMYERGIAAGHMTQVLKFGGGNQNIVVRLTLARPTEGDRRCAAIYLASSSGFELAADRPDGGITSSP
jgi:hypothetical protein